MKENLTISTGREKPYEIWIREDFQELREALLTLSLQDRKVLIVTDTHVAPLYLSEISSILSSVFSSVSTIILEEGEEHKQLSEIQKIYEKAIEEGLDRKDLFAALGGGVIGDMTGFAAATYLRGIPFLQIPTTLLSQLDSSIGGKTGVDFLSYKNMVGAFHQPLLVYSGVSALDTLEDRQFASGMGEMIKHALLYDRAYFDFLYENRGKIALRDRECLFRAILWSDTIKREIVEKDPTERGDRKLLNFGHTLGHAIERTAHFRYTHGQCVALGCLLAIGLSGTAVSGQETERVRELMRSMGLLTELREALSLGEIIECTRKDKKMEQGRVQFILLRELGKAYITKDVSEEDMRRVLRHIME